ncbi:MAG TPA: Crp/Fnr family transcriptional regulator [Chryseosolibacter sp.]|nr:Crp/Fnr family transcriptional regulator [Chryseosolibacter sp.]
MKAPAQIADFRDHVSRFVVVDDDVFESIMKFFTPRRFAKDQMLTRAGDVVRHTHWLKKGLVISTHTDDRGKDHIIQFANEGCWVTDQNGFYNRTKATFNIQCIEETEVLSLSFEKREQLCEQFPVMERFFRRKANESFTKQQKRLLTYMTSDAQQRYELFLQEYPSLLQRVSKKMLAAYLGVSRETLSRFSAKMSKTKK